jgi:Fe2+ or Zn2+ uptake regulation protein
MTQDLVTELREHGIQPSTHRVAIAEFVLSTDLHPTADEVWQRVQKRLPVVSRATVYNTLNLFVEKGLLRALFLAEGVVVFDPKFDRHHHFIDETTGRIHDVPWDEIEVRNAESLDGFDTRDYMVVLRGSRLPSRR